MYLSRFFRPTNREKNLQFIGVNESKIRWTVVEIKFIKGKRFKEIWETKIKNLALKICKKIIEIEKLLSLSLSLSLSDGLESTNGPLIVELQKPHGASLGISLRGMET